MTYSVSGITFIVSWFLIILALTFIQVWLQNRAHRREKKL